MATNKKNKWGLLYKVISGLTLALPISITLVVSAIWSKPSAEVVVLFDTTNEVSKVEQLTDYFEFGVIDKDTNYMRVRYDRVASGKVYYADFTTYDKTKVMASSTPEPYEVYTLKVKDYIRFIGNDIDEIIEITIDIGSATPTKVKNINIETGNKLSMSFIISVIATIIVVLIISGKMNLHKKYPKSATFIALLSATIFLGIINAIIGNIFAVFIVATISWGSYCIESYYYNNYVLEQTSQEKKTSALTKALRDLDI